MNRRGGSTMLLAALIAVTFAACSMFGGGGADIEQDSDLEAALRAMNAEREGGVLADHTDFEWDMLHVFGEAAAREDIEAAVGEPVISGDFYYDQGSLLVFTRGGEVVRAISLVPDFLVADPQVWTPDVRLEPQGSGALRLVEG